MKSWADEVRESTTAPLVLVHTKNDMEAEQDLERLSDDIEAFKCVTTSAKTGVNIEKVFELCISASKSVLYHVSEYGKERLKRPTTLNVPTVKNHQSKSSYKSDIPTSFLKNFQSTVIGEQITGRHFALGGYPVERDSLSKTKKLSSISNHSEDGESQMFCPDSRSNSINSQFRENLIVLNNLVKSPSPTPSFDAVVHRRSHSSLSAQVRPSRLYRRSNARLSMHSKLKAVSIPLSPNCDTTQKRDIDRYQYSDTSSILSPTDSTASSVISYNLSMPPFRNSKYLALPSPSPSCSSNAFNPFSPTSFTSSLSSESDIINRADLSINFKRKNIMQYQNKMISYNDQIVELEEPSEVLSGCSIFSPEPKSKLSCHNAPFYKNKTKNESLKARCSIM